MGRKPFPLGACAQAQEHVHSSLELLWDVSAFQRLLTSAVVNIGVYLSTSFSLFGEQTQKGKSYSDSVSCQLVSNQPWSAGSLQSGASPETTKLTLPQTGAGSWRASTKVFLSNHRMALKFY